MSKPLKWWLFVPLPPPPPRLPGDPERRLSALDVHDTDGNDQCLVAH